MRCPNVTVALAAIAMLSPLVLDDSVAWSQAINSGGSRVFVTGFTPVIGRNGGVGGVTVDVDGQLKRIEVLPDQSLAAARQRAKIPRHNELRRKSEMRMVSLRRLEQEFARAASEKEPLTQDLLFLAGLQRIEYVFAYPDLGDVVIAGPAEGWEFKGDVAVGMSSREPVLRLDDLLDALHSNAAAPDGSDGISCSIDPDPTGMTRVQRMLAAKKLRISESLLRRMETVLGDQRVTLTGIRPTSHFARVLTGADYMMKRIAMGLERVHQSDLTSYLQMIKGSARPGLVSAPRWWMATNYDSVSRSDDGLAFRFQGPAVKAMSEHGYLNSRGELVNAGRPSPQAQRWADDFTRDYDQLVQEMPIFGQLRGCFDLALLAALIHQESLLERAECPLTLLTDPTRAKGEPFVVPQRIASLASSVRGRSGWVISVSGGVDVDTWTPLEQSVIDPNLNAVRERAVGRHQHWWWDS